MTSSEQNNLERSLRMRFYGKIKEKGEFSETFISPPPHWINSNIFSVDPKFDSSPHKNKSIITILSIWNTMIGSSIVSVPYCVYHAGLIPTVILCILYGLICYYTCQVVVKTGGNDNDYSDTVHRFIGPKYGFAGRVTQISFNLLINSGATFIYFLIINQNLYPCLACFINLFGYNLNTSDNQPHFDQFSIFYCGLIISFLVFPLLIMKKINFLIKINSYGIYFMLILLVFIIYTGFSSIYNTTYDFNYLKNSDDPTQPRHLYLFGENPSLLAGSLTMGFFSHSFVLPIIKNNANQKNNKRDLFYGYCLVTLTYIIIGILGYIGFSGKKFSPNFYDNWFRFFTPEDPVIIVLRILNVIQLLSVYPILFYIVRIQFFGTFYKDNYPSKAHVMVFSSILLSLCLVILYTCWDTLGKLISIIGATTGLVLIYFIPLLINIVYYRVKHPEVAQTSRNSSLVGSQEDRLVDQEDKTEGVVKSEGGINEEEKIRIGVSKKPFSKTKNNFFYASQILIMIFGIFTMIIQFISINFFGITIR